VCGVYIGWAALANHGVYKMVMNIGWSPYFDNAEKTVESWLLHDFAEDFYGVELRLVVVGYIRSEVGVPIIAQRNRLVYQTPHPSCY
jgi:FAD synthase